MIKICLLSDFLGFSPFRSWCALVKSPETVLNVTQTYVRQEFFIAG